MIKKILFPAIPLVVLLATASCSSGQKSKTAPAQETDEIGKAFANQPYQVTVTGGEVVATKKNPLIEYFSVRPGDLQNLASSQTPFTMLGFSTEVLKNSQGKNDGVRLTQKDGVGSKYGFKDKDVIVGVNRIQVRSGNIVNKIFAIIAKEGKVDVTVRRGSTPHKIILSKAEK